MTGVLQLRGQPVVALAAVLGVWVGARVLIREGEPMRPAGIEPAALAQESGPPPDLRGGGAPWPARGRHPPAAAEETSSASAADPRSRSDRVASSLVPAPVHLSAPPPGFAPPPGVPRAEPPGPAFEPVPVVVSAGHQLMWMAALAQLPLPRLPQAGDPHAVAPAAPPAFSPAQPAARARRWSGDGWLLLRRGGNVALAPAPASATYGASQLGAVVRYHLAPGSPHRPAAYLRGSAALNRSREKELAAGLSARPLGAIPVTLAAELRVTEDRFGRRTRPAVMAVSEAPPQALPAGLRAEAYVQAGYVGGRGATFFADGQLRVDRSLGGIGGGDLRAGAGVWGGAQEGAARLDLGPTVTLGVPVGGSAGARLAFDWRFRVAGNAAPASGPALTLSAGF